MLMPVRPALFAFFCFSMILKGFPLAQPEDCCPQEVTELDDPCGGESGDQKSVTHGIAHFPASAATLC